MHVIEMGHLLGNGPDDLFASVTNIDHQSASTCVQIAGAGIILNPDTISFDCSRQVLVKSTGENTAVRINSLFIGFQESILKCEIPSSNGSKTQYLTGFGARRPL